MDIKMSRNDHTGHDELVISDDSNWDLFQTVASALELRFRGSWTARLDGIDQRYWDLQVGDAAITLHFEHYLGIMLFVAHDAPNQAASQVLFENAHDYLASYEPT